MHETEYSPVHFGRGCIFNALLDWSYNKIKAADETG